MKGFDNIGNTCYLNAGLQMIIQNKLLCNLILKYSQQSPILKIIGNFINEYYFSTSQSISPIHIKQIVEQKQELFCGYNQQDSTEFIIYLLDTIDEEIKKIDSDSKGIEPIFGIQLNSRIKCKLKTCLKIYNKQEYNNILLLDIDSECKSLNDTYRKFKRSNKLETDNKYFCESCNDKRVASKRSEIKEWPPYLFIWFKRYNQTGRKIIKNSQPINIDIEWRHGYLLQGAVIHSGSLYGGHYIYVGKHDDNKWYLFNDSSVTEIRTIDELKIHLSNAYWLCYKK
jgi:ubiquitin C-terminal hydrolase